MNPNEQLDRELEKIQKAQYEHNKQKHEKRFLERHQTEPGYIAIYYSFEAKKQDKKKLLHNIIKDIYIRITQMSANEENNTIYEVYEDNLKEVDKLIYQILNDYYKARKDSFTNQGGAVDGYSYIQGIKSTIKEALLSEMPKGYVAKDLDYKYIYYNKALEDCLEAIKKVLE